MNKNANQFALVTGASSGIGVEVAKLLAQRGYNLIIVARRADKLAELSRAIREEHDVEVLDFMCDLSVESEVQKLIGAIDSKVEQVEILINNAGFGLRGFFIENNFEPYRDMMNLNMNNLTLLTHHYLKKMTASGSGYVLQVSSIGAYQPSPYYAVYAATKSYVLNFSAALNYELKNTNVSVTTLCPGGTTTEFQDVAGHDISPLMRKLAFMSAEKVAAIGLKAMFRRRTVVTAGLMNKIMYLNTRILPRSVSTWLAGKFSE